MIRTAGGPEVATLNNPEDGVTYRVGVNYYNDHGYGRSEMTVLIFVSGTKVYQASRWLESRGDFWEVASLSWPSLEMSIIDHVTTGSFPVCP